MRLLILGAGATGGYYGARLVKAGVDTTFLVRPARAENIARDGLRVKSPRGDARLQVEAVTAAGGGFDAVILSCKAYDLGSATDAIAPAVEAGARVLPLLNGMAHLDALDARFGRDCILGGLCHVGVTLAEGGEIVHLNDTEHLALGPRTPSQEGACADLHATLAHAGLAPTLRPDIDAALWEKFVLLASGAGITCLMRAPIGTIVATQDGEALTRELIQECAAVAAAEGRPLGQKPLAQIHAMMTQKGSAGTTSMLRDVWRGGPTEGEHVLGDMVGRARAHGLPATLLRTCRAHLQAHEITRLSTPAPASP